MSAFGLSAALSAASSPSDATNLFIQAGEGNLSFVRSQIPPLPPDHADPNGYTCLHAAAAYARVGVLEYLLSAGGDVNVADADGDTPLHHCETAAFAAVLVGRGADHLRRNGEGKTPLEVRVEEAIAETDQDYDDEDEEQINSKEIIGYLMTLPGYEREGGERSAKRAR
jgi:ankyrin repeat protein